MTKEERINAAVAIVSEEAERALNSEGATHRAGYTEAHSVATKLAEQGVITHEHLASESWSSKETARKSIEGKAKRLLDEAAQGGRILRLSSRDHASLPQLDGQARTPYGQAVYYTTPELHATAQAAVDARLAEERAQQAEMDALLARGKSLGLPPPDKTWRDGVTYDRRTLRLIVARLEAAYELAGGHHQ
jgi:hypothetical protein